MFQVTPVDESKERKVSFSPDVEKEYRHNVVEKIRGLMEEVQVRQPFLSNLQTEPTRHNFSKQP